MEAKMYENGHFWFLFCLKKDVDMERQTGGYPQFTGS